MSILIRGLSQWQIHLELPQPASSYPPHSLHIARLGLTPHMNAALSVSRIFEDGWAFLCITTSASGAPTITGPKIDRDCRRGGLHPFSPTELAWQRTPAAEAATREAVAMQEIVLPPEIELADGVIVFVVEQRSVPVVVDPLVVLELEFVEIEVLVVGAAVLVLGILEADVEEAVECVVVDAAALEGAAVRWTLLQQRIRQQLSTRRCGSLLSF